MQINDELNTKLDETRKHAKKFHLDLKKANKMLKWLQDRVMKLQEDKHQQKPSSMKDVIPPSLNFLIWTHIPRFRLKSPDLVQLPAVS